MGYWNIKFENGPEKMQRTIAINAIMNIFDCEQCPNFVLSNLKIKLNSVKYIEKNRI